MKRNRIPKGCVHPDCFHCTLKDCTRDGCVDESVEINAVLNSVLHPKKEEVVNMAFLASYRGGRQGLFDDTGYDFEEDICNMDCDHCTSDCPYEEREDEEDDQD